MAITVAELVYKITGDTSQIKKGLQSTDSAAKKTGQVITGVANAIKASFIAAAVVGIGRFSKKLIDAASDAAEAQNAVNVTFKESSDVIQDFARNSATAVGISSTKFKELSTVIGAQLKLSGKAIDDVATDTVNLTKRAADLASVFNVEVSEATTALGAALRGESEPARRFGINISDAAVQAEALASGLVKSKKEITDQVKVQARLNLIYKQSADVQGDFQNTSDGFANSQKILKERLADISVELGDILLPTATKLVNLINDKFVPAIESLVDSLDALSPVATVIGAVFSILFSLIGTGVKNIISSFKNLGQAVISPTKAIVSLLKGDFKGALDDLKNGAIDLTEVFTESFDISKQGGQDVIDAFNRIKNAITGNNDALDKLGNKAEETGKKVSDVAPKPERTKAQLAADIEEYAVYFQSLSQLASAFGDLQSALTDRRINEIEAQRQAALEAAGVAEETAVESAQAQLDTAIENGDEVAQQEAETALKRAQINEQYDKERAQAEYKGALAGWRLQVLDAAARAALAVVSAYQAPPVAWPVTVPVAITAGLASTAAVGLSRPTPPQLASGGIATPTAGGSNVIVAENGNTEGIFNAGAEGQPLVDTFVRAFKEQGTMMGTLNIYINDILTKSTLYDVTKNREAFISAEAIQ